MGQNDRQPQGSASLQPWKQREPKAVLTWGNIPPNVIVDLVATASKIGAYIGFGMTSDSTALLLYVKNGRINERVAIESIKEAAQAVEWVINNYLQSGQ